MAEDHPVNSDVWVAAGLRTPFVKSDGVLSGYDAIGLSVPVAAS